MRDNLTKLEPLLREDEPDDDSGMAVIAYALVACAALLLAGLWWV